MALVDVLKRGATGHPTHLVPAADDIAALSFQVDGGGPVLSGTGLDLATQNISNAGDIDFDDPTTNTIEQTAGVLIIDDIMAKERSNIMASGSDILFGSVGDVAGELDAFQIPQASALPTATPAANSNQGFLVSYNGKLYFWTGSAWDDYSIADATGSVRTTYTAAVGIAAREVVYISAANNVSLADNDGLGSSYVVGLAVAAATATNPVEVQSHGLMSGFSGLTPGAIYYLSDTAGGITATVPTGNRTIVRIGYAKSATELFIDTEFFVNRGAT